MLVGGRCRRKTKYAVRIGCRLDGPVDHDALIEQFDIDRLRVGHPRNLSRSSRSVLRAGTRSSDTLLPRRDLERARLEALENLAEARNALPIARERTPVPHRCHALPWAKAHDRLWTLEIAKQERLGIEPLAAAPVDPFTPALHELLLPPGLHVPGRVRVRRFHGSSSRRPARSNRRLG